VRKIGIWEHRGAYLEANKRFIEEKGGKIERIFLIEFSLLDSDDNVAAIGRLMENHSRLGIDVSLHFLDLLPAEYREDFVLFGDGCAMVETEQADEDFT